MARRGVDSRTWQILAGIEETTAEWDPPCDGPTRSAVFVCAHGAGGHMADAGVLGVTRALRDRGVGTVRFNFFYRARKSARPDPMPRLLGCLEAVVARVRGEIDPPRLVLGGRSMGGRVASVLVSEGPTCEGLLLLAYPLHPPGQPGKLRTEHLPRIQVPVLCVNGTRDPFCTRGLMESTLAGLGPNWRMHWVEGADHGFHVLKSSGRTDRDVLTEIGDLAAEWIAGL
jgi:uncharacterized protein